MKDPETSFIKIDVYTHPAGSEVYTATFRHPGKDASYAYLRVEPRGILVDVPWPDAPLAGLDYRPRNPNDYDTAAVLAYYLYRLSTSSNLRTLAEAIAAAHHRPHPAASARTISLTERIHRHVVGVIAPDGTMAPAAHASLRSHIDRLARYADGRQEAKR